MKPYSLDAYFAKVELNFQEFVQLRKTNDVEALKQLYFAHVTHFPYNNIELRQSSLKHPIHRQPLTFFNPHRMMDAGGYCYQSNALLYSVLIQLGYEPEFCEARILIGAPVNAPEILNLPVTHVVLKVPVEGITFLLEPSLGMQTPRFPIQIDEKKETIIQYKDEFRFYQEQDQYVLEKKMKGHWFTLMQTDLNKVPFETLEMNLLKLQWFPKPIAIRDEKTVVALITERGSKALFWDTHTNNLRYWLQEDDSFTSHSIDDWDEANRILLIEFKIQSSSFNLRYSCSQLSQPLPIRRWEVEFPLTSEDLNKMRNNVA